MQKFVFLYALVSMIPLSVFTLLNVTDIGIFASSFVIIYFVLRLVLNPRIRTRVDYLSLVFLGIVLGGSISISGLQSSFFGQNNPNVIPSQYNLTSLALFYNQTLTQISQNSFKNASAAIQAASFQNYPSYIAGIADQANGELASINYSLTTAHFDLNESNYYITTGLYTNASQSLLVGCSAIRSANSTFSQFQGPITNSLGQAGVQISLYSIGGSELKSSIITFSNQCNSYSQTLG